MGIISTFKGMVGESKVNLGYWLLLDNKIYHRINNVTLPLAGGGSTQIDHIIVSRYGIFVIETKNYKGWIFGEERQAQWTQKFANGASFQFQNPLRQNYLHLKTLGELLNLPNNKFHSMVIFIGDCQLKTADKLPNNVMHKFGWVNYVKSKKIPLLTEKQVEQIIDKIENARFTKSFKTNSQHKKYIREKRAEIIDKDNLFADLQEILCPQCNSPMIKRTAKIGKNKGSQFWGCSQYPQCKGTRSC